MKICISPKPSVAPVAKVPLQVLKELEHQARQNLSTINFTAFAGIASSCNTVLEKGLHSAKATIKKAKSQILKGADPDRAIRQGYESACDYFEVMEKRILIQQRALACLSSSSHPSEGTIHHGQHWPSTKRGRNDPPSSPSRGLEMSRIEELALLAYSSFQVSISQRWRGLPP